MLAQGKALGFFILMYIPHLVFWESVIFKNQLREIEFVVRAVGSTNLSKKLFEFKVAEIIDSMVLTDTSKWKLSPGTHGQAMIINVLRERRPLYKVEEAMTKVDTYDSPMPLFPCG